MNDFEAMDVFGVLYLEGEWTAGTGGMITFTSTPLGLTRNPLRGAFVGLDRVYRTDAKSANAAIHARIYSENKS